MIIMILTGDGTNFITESNAKKELDRIVLKYHDMSKEEIVDMLRYMYRLANKIKS